MTTSAVAPIRVSAPRRAAVRAPRGERIKRAVRRRAGRIWGLLLVLSMLLPVLITSAGSR
jgi:hypothetical protein